MLGCTEKPVSGRVGEIPHSGFDYPIPKPHIINLKVKGIYLCEKHSQCRIDSTVYKIVKIEPHQDKVGEAPVPIQYMVTVDTSPSTRLSFGRILVTEWGAWKFEVLLTRAAMPMTSTAEDTATFQTISKFEPSNEVKEVAQDGKEAIIPLPEDFDPSIFMPQPLTIAVDKRNKPPEAEVARENRIYCNECEFCTEKPRSGLAVFRPYAPNCLHVLNVTERQAFLAVMYQLIKRPKDINRDNDCQWFVKKRGFIARLFKGFHKDRIGSGEKIYLPEWDSPPPRKLANKSPVKISFFTSLCKVNGIECEAIAVEESADRRGRLITVKGHIHISYREEYRVEYMGKAFLAECEHYATGYGLTEGITSEMKLREKLGTQGGIRLVD
jgi:hypothetical protein